MAKLEGVGLTFALLWTGDAPIAPTPAPMVAVLEGWTIVTVTTSVEIAMVAVVEMPVLVE